ncbi:peptidoglycan-binding domain-containing protein [Streptomyces sp. MST-110588]|uniref:peptidoglycan-binding domain-containing protein n=1 Tax=Streptomyces sp. MST-110588 TaxID=2833628 RepID=UPI001F5C1865|nr:peptidoglycan-binding domain-containing protein [Streptomyces sp. MST-110588]UNO42308.1 peptidoglycan-binding protein [Streptomyces sp. MST-110588]
MTVPSATSAGLATSAGSAASAGSATTATSAMLVRRHRRKQAAVAAMAVTAAGLAAGAVLLSGALLTDADDDRALPDGRQDSHVPTRPTEGEARRSAGAVPSPGSPGAPGSSSPTASAAASPSALPSRTTAGSRPSDGVSRAPSRSPVPSPAVTTVSGTVSQAPDGDGTGTPPGGPLVLREGASGPEVVELQDRLRQVGGYAGPADGRYDADVREAVAAYQRAYQVRGDPEGVYGPWTRRSLESRTDEP